MSKQMSKENE
jgi:hypothetical protein